MATRRWRPILAAAAALTAVAVVLSGCAAGSAADTVIDPASSAAELGDVAATPVDDAPGGVEDAVAGHGSDGVTASSSAVAPLPEVVDSDAVDALSRTGPSVADEVPDMTPFITGAVPRLPTTVTDAQGKSITIEKADRVISLDLYGTLTDTIIGLGLQDRLVGRGVSDTQDSLRHLPIVSLGGIDLNSEAVLSLHPDLILTNLTIGSDAIYRQLEAAGVTVVRFDQVPAISSISHQIHSVGEVFGMAAQADQLSAHTEKELARARLEIVHLRAATPLAPRAAVMYVRGTAGVFFILGADYGATDVLRELGLDDVASENGITNLTPANAESLVQLDPQIVLTMKAGLETAGGVDGLLARPGMSATAAGRNKRIVSVVDSQLLSYGPRTPANLVAVAKAIYTDDVHS